MKFIILAIASLFSLGSFAQDRTTVTATTADISDNLDLRAVASIFGDSENLEDFERRLNDPKIQISNLDLNQDSQVDYLRVIESVDDYTHLIIIQSVLGRDVFQDVATVEVERDRNNNVQIQVVGDVYMYGNNYIYEPVYVHTPVIYSTFWSGGYRPYYSSWYWGYYPSYYYAWQPYPVATYWNNVNVYVVNNHYNYVNVRRSHRAIALHNGRRANAYEVRHPERSFIRRNTTVSNRHELDQVRSTGTRTATASNIRSTSNPSGTRTAATGVRSTGSTTNGTRTNAATTTPRNATGTRAATPGTRNAIRTAPSTSNSTSPSGVRSAAPTTGTRSASVSGTRATSASSTTPRSTVKSNTRSAVQNPVRSSQIASPRPSQIQSATRSSVSPSRTSSSATYGSPSFTPRANSTPQRASASSAGQTRQREATGRR
ncbi:MAG TPA: hypothetical protein VGB50_10815 [Flavobacterium sp.]